MIRGVELINYSPDGKGSGGKAMSEAHLDGGRRITLREIVDTHFKENADQVYSHLLFVNKLLRATGGKFTLSPEILFPILTEQKTAAHNTNNFTLFAEFPYSDSTKLGYRFRDALLKELGRPCEVIVSDDDGKTILKTIFKMRDHGDTAQQSSDNRKNSYIFLEEKSEFIGTKYLSLSIVEDSNEANIPGSSSSTTKTIFTFEIKQQLSSDIDGLLDWTNTGSAEWATGEEEPYVFLTNEAIRILAEPMNIRNNLFDTSKETFDSIRKIWKHILPDPNSEFFNFPIIITNPESHKERYRRPYYYLELALLGAKMINLSVLSNRDVSRFETIADESKEMFKDEMLKFQDGVFMLEFTDEALKGGLTYSPIEYLMYELLLQGVDIWPYLDDFENSMVQSFRTNPDRFRHTLNALGFDQVLPIFKGMNDSERASFFRDLKPSDDISRLKQIFSLIPSLIPYHDNTPGKEREQSDKYYAQLTIGLADYSYQIGQEPVAAIAVHEGKIIGARRNDTKQRGKKIDHKRHAEILLIEGLGDNLKPGTKLYVTLVPCKQCTYHIRRNPNIAEVNCSADSSMGDAEELTNQHLREINRDETITEEPPLVRIGLLENAGIELYKRTGWPNMPIYHGTGVRVIDNRGKRHFRTAVIFPVNKHHRDLLERMREDE